MIDLRSDTVTKPSHAMLEAMFAAKVGDDVLGEDPTVIALENKTAEIFGCEAGIFCPSGTMTNQIGINVLTQPYEEVICYEGSHIYKYEGGGAAGTSGLSFKLLKGDRGRISAKEVEESINPDDIHYPKSSLLSLENTVNKGGGSYYTLTEIEALSVVARENQLKLHLDGARIFNALTESGDKASDYGQYFDTISVCLSKGLGAPVGSVLVGKRQYINKARRVRKFLGGGMRQAGYLAAAGIYALENNIDRLKEDHAKAKRIANTLEKCNYVSEVYPVETNIIIFKVKDETKTSDVLSQLKSNQILASAFGPNEIRFVTHLDIKNEDVDLISKKLIDI